MKRQTLLFILICINSSAFAQQPQTYASWQEDYVGWCTYMPEQLLYDNETNLTYELKEHDAFTKSQLAKIDSMSVSIFKRITKGNELYTEVLEIEINMYERQTYTFDFYSKVLKKLNKAINLNEEAIATTEKIHKIKNEIAYESSFFSFTELMEQNIQKYKLMIGRLEEFKRRESVKNSKKKMNLQPLRIHAGWQVTYNQLYEIDPIVGNEDYFEGSSLLTLKDNTRLKLIDVQWRPERAINGAYQVAVLNFLENFNPTTNQFDIDPNWENPVLNFTTQSRIELVEKLEELMRTLPIYEDPRITSKRGVVSEPSESYRLALQDKGISTELVKNILENGNAKIQSLVLDHKNITRKIILKFHENGITKGVKNKANQKLNSKRFRV